MDLRVLICWYLNRSNLLLKAGYFYLPVNGLNLFFLNSSARGLSGVKETACAKIK